MRNSGRFALSRARSNAWRTRSNAWRTRNNTWRTRSNTWRTRSQHAADSPRARVDSQYYSVKFYDLQRCRALCRSESNCMTGEGVGRMSFSGSGAKIPFSLPRTLPRQHTLRRERNGPQANHHFVTAARYAHTGPANGHIEPTAAPFAVPARIAPQTQSASHGSGEVAAVTAPVTAPPATHVKKPQA